MARLAMANGAAALAAFLGLLWLILAMGGFTWVSSTSILIDFNASLLSVTASEGTITGLVKITARAFKPHRRFFRNFFGKTIWLEDVRDSFCSGLGKTLQWCDMWEIVIFSSYLMCFLCVAAGVALASGGGLMYYYANNHATETGRLAARSCFIGAPCAVLFGLLQYSFCTQEFGQMSVVEMGPMKAQAMYGMGYLFAWLLFFVSWLPLYFQGLFLKDALEKRHWDDREKEAIFGDQRQNYATCPQPAMTSYQVPMAAPGADFGVTVMATGPMAVSGPVVTGAPVVMSSPPMMVSGPEVVMVQQGAPMPQPTGMGPQANFGPGPPQGPGGLGGAAW